MSTFEEDCHTDKPNNTLTIDSFRLPLDSSMQMVFTGYFNGFCVEVRSADEVALLYHMGCFGKGSTSRSKPKVIQSNPPIMRKRQFLKRNYWYKKFGSPIEVSETDLFLKEIDAFAAQMINDNDKQSDKDVIDLVSSEEEQSDMSNDECHPSSFPIHDNHDTVVIVPNSDSEGDDYFANMKPKCCISKIKLQEKLILTLQEAFFLSYGLGCLQIINNQNRLLTTNQCWALFTEIDKMFIEKYVVYHYFRSKGYIVKPGIKFGGDYLLYKDSPGNVHADYIVVLRNAQVLCNWTSILGHVRMAVTAVKEILIVEVIKPARYDLKLPRDLCEYRVQEMVLSRNIPLTINEHDD